MGDKNRAFVGDNGASVEEFIRGLKLNGSIEIHYVADPDTVLFLDGKRYCNLPEIMEALQRKYPVEHETKLIKDLETF